MRKSQLLAHDGVKETVRKNKKVLMSDKYIITHDRHRFFFYNYNEDSSKHDEGRINIFMKSGI